MKLEQLVRGWLCAAALLAPGCGSLDESPTSEDGVRSDVALFRLKDAGPVEPSVGLDAGDMSWVPPAEAGVGPDSAQPDAGAGGPCSPWNGDGGAVNEDGGFVSEDCKCTRRPEEEPSPSCPPGSGVSSSATLGIEGGTVLVSGTASTVGVAAQVKIAPGALRHETNVTLKELKSPPPPGYVDYSPVYKVAPVGLALDVLGELVLPWRNQGSQISATLAVFRADAPEGPFSRVAGSYINAGFMQAPLTQGGYYFAGYEAPTGQIYCP